MITWPEIQPSLTDGRLTLRPTEATDAPLMFAYVAGDDDVAEYTTVPVPYLMHHAVEAIDKWAKGYEAKELMQFAITVDDGPIIGHISLQYVSLLDHNVELGYILSKDVRGQGLGAQAAS